MNTEQLNERDTKTAVELAEFLHYRHMFFNDCNRTDESDEKCIQLCMLLDDLSDTIQESADLQKCERTAKEYISRTGLAF